MPTLEKRFPTGGIGIKEKPYNREILRKNLIFHGVTFQVEKFLVSSFVKIHFNFCCVNTMGFL